jgi:tetratricopeptide (TPR) repeat protein
MHAALAPRRAPLFSVVVLTRNEARALPRLLYPLEDFRERGGEVLVMDTGSTDDTIAIARKRGCRVEMVNEQFDSVLDSERAAAIEERFAKAGEGPLVEAGQRLFHFGEARQHAGSLTVNPFVLQLDASDEVSAFDTDALDGWIGAGDVGAFEYDQLYGNVRLRISRFYDRRQYHWEGRVHEHLAGTARTDASPVRRARCAPAQLMVRHHQGDKERNYLAGLALQVLEHPEKPRWWHYLGRELFYESWYESALATLDVHANMADAWPAERSQSLCFMGESFEAVGCRSEAEERYRRAFAIDPTRREPLLRLAMTSCRRGEFDAAAHWARQALTVDRTNAYPELEANYTWFPHAVLYWSLFWLGRRDEARVHWDAYLSLVPGKEMVRPHARLFPPVGEARRRKSPLCSVPGAS